MYVCISPLSPSSTYMHLQMHYRIMYSGILFVTVCCTAALHIGAEGADTVWAKNVELEETYSEFQETKTRRGTFDDSIPAEESLPYYDNNSDWYGENTYEATHDVGASDVQGRMIAVGDDAQVETIEVHQTAPTTHSGVTNRNSGKPGQSLLSLAETMRRSDPRMNEALLMNFCHSLMRLKTAYVGLEEAYPSQGFLYAALSPAELHAKVKALSAKLRSVLIAVEGSPNAAKALSFDMLMPFGKLMQEGEDVLFGCARHGDPAAFITCLQAVAPAIIRGLTYLETPVAENAAGVLNLLRNALLERTRELDDMLLEAQEDPQQLLNNYTAHMSDDELQQERNIAKMHGKVNTEFLASPVYRPEHLIKPSSSRRSTFINVSIFILVILALLFTKAATSIETKGETYIYVRGGIHHSFEN